MNEKVFKLEITMESRQGEKHHYIKRSFPAERGKLDIRKYGYPFSRYGEIEIRNLIGEGYLEVTFNGKGFPVYLNQFHTEREENVAVHIDPYMKVPVMDGMEVIHTTFYLYIE
jgi:hypothetical protein